MVLLIIGLLVPIVAGCDNPLGVGPDGKTRFELQTLKFEYDWDYHRMSVTNPPGKSAWFNAKICDWDCDRREGVSHTLAGGQTWSYNDQYWHGVRLEIAIKKDGVKNTYWVDLE